MRAFCCALVRASCRTPVDEVLEDALALTGLLALDAAGHERRRAAAGAEQPGAERAARARRGRRLARRAEAQRRVRQAHHVATLVGQHAQVRGHAGQKLHRRVFDRDHGRVDDDVRHGLRAEPDELHPALEGAVRKGVDGEEHGLVRPHPADVGLVDVGVDLHVPQILRHQEQGRGLQRGRDRLPEFDRALHDHAVDRRADLRVAQIDLDLADHRFALEHARARGGELAFEDARIRHERAARGIGGLRLGVGGIERRALARERGARLLERDLGRDAAARELGLARVGLFGVGEERGRTLRLRGHVGDGGAGALDVGRFFSI